ncbi:peptidoglycan binding domain containing [Pyrenophora seminiperda CCB06]|uniref:Peptidoglycan binding domain containing n=1 Tax=Pyrenophora seminiperda CCB06 TaxID=1302712 RepID=A0A3M7LX19_9PLEO|nr:peptidoglycan binding domain containing [Pyrenophora seminiperda CCB06]
MHRRLVICCDGTWQSSVTSKANVPSNVTKLCRLIARTGSDRFDPTKKFHQIVYYDSGIGTGDLSHSEASRQGGTGAGLAENVIEAYNFIVQNYLPGDEIFCFGFSRGAYTARAVAGLVSDIGVISPVNMQLFPELYNLYMKTDVGIDFRNSKGWKWFTEGKLSAHGEALVGEGTAIEELVELSKKNLDKKKVAEVWEIRPHGDLAVSTGSRNVKVVGVWDTVGALGIPDVVGLNFSHERERYAFHNVKLTENIEHAFQALAMDERREAFRPTLWYIPWSVINAPEKRTPDLKQVWFPGVHTNCGGGSQDALEDMKADAENIATATLCWMLQVIAPYLAIDRKAFDDYMDQYQRWLFRIRYACTYHHAGQLEKYTSYLPALPFSTYFSSTPKRPEPHTHNLDLGWGLGPIVDSYGGIYKYNYGSISKFGKGGARLRAPGYEEGELYIEDEKTHKWSLKWSPLTKAGHTNEYIHPIAYYRRLVLPDPDPNSPIKDWKRGSWKDDVSGKVRFWWYKDEAEKSKALPEWAVLPERDVFNFERHWYNKCDKTLALQKLTEAEAEGFGPGKDFLDVLDKTIDFGADWAEQNSYSSTNLEPAKPTAKGKNVGGNK